MTASGGQGAAGARERSDPLRRNAGLLGTIFLFSLFTNALMLTGPLFMLQVYDRVLGSRSEETLLALSLLVGFLFVMMGLLDHARGRIAARIGARLQDGLDARVFKASLAQAARRDGAQTGLHDLESVQRLFSSPVFMALFDIPWTPLFLVAIFVFHVWLGWFALASGVLLIAIAFTNQRFGGGTRTQAGAAALAAERMAWQMQADVEVIRSLGMQGAALARWRKARQAALAATIRASDRAGGVSVLTKTLRLFLQSSLLGLGAWLVLRDELTAGAMIAASILLGRALAPIDLAVAQWPLVHRAREGWVRLGTLLSNVPPAAPRLPLPRPEARLEVSQLTVAPPGQPQATLRMVSFRLDPGQAVGVIGPSGAGKSTLARALTGTWAPAGGQIRLGGATLDQYDADTLGALVGYLPQTVSLFDATIAQNIARLAEDPDPGAVVAAARKAAAHDLILRQPQGYDTPVNAIGSRLSGGQVQRIGLARALFGDPVLLVLDEPNSNLDNEGGAALNHAIRTLKAEGRSVLIMAHRPAAIAECDVLLVLDGGVVRAFGPRNDVLRQTVQNHLSIRDDIRAGGVA